MDKDKKCNECLKCHKPATLRCGRCLGAAFCGVPCQRASWPAHKAGCRIAANVIGGRSSADIDKVIASLHTGVAAGDAVALFMLGLHVNAGAGTTQNVAEGQRLFKLAGDKGLATALLMDGERLFDDGRFSDALVLLTRAAEPSAPRSELRTFRNFTVNEAVPEAAAQFLLGKMYMFGNGVAVDKQRALALWSRAMSAGNEDAAQALLSGLGK
jgi:hypothetical protein